MPNIGEILNWFQENGQTILKNGVNVDQEINRPRAIDECTVSNISFLGVKYADTINEVLLATKCIIVFIDDAIVQPENLTQYSDIAFILSKDPKSDVILFCEYFLKYNDQKESESIDASALLAENVKIGKCVDIGANVVIEENVLIGDYCIIGPNTILKAGTELANYVEIGSCNVIGGIGFGYSQNKNGEYEQFPHYGAVILKDHVHIGNNTCIDRGSLSDTILYEGVKVDNLVHIAHNVKIGKNSLIIAQSMIAGSVTIGENCWIAPSSCIRNAVKIGNQVTIGLASTVTKNVPDNSTVLGSPALPIEEFVKLRKIQKKCLEENK